jgi:hypothetical protein
MQGAEPLPIHHSILGGNIGFLIRCSGRSAAIVVESREARP